MAVPAVVGEVTRARPRAREKKPARGSLAMHLRALSGLPRDLVLGRTWYRCKLPLFGLALYGASLPRSDALAPLATPPDPWPGHAESGAAIVAGRFAFAGQTIESPEPPWAPREADAAWLAEMHSFSWLRDLRALGGDSARRCARDLVVAWLDSQDRWSPLAWDPAILARRLSHWLGQYDFFAGSAESAFRQRLVASSVRQAAHLYRVLPAGLVGAELICALKGLAMAGACLPASRPWLERALSLLRRELVRQVVSDGGQIERSPARHLAVLRDLIDVKSTLHAAGAPLPEDLQAAIEAMAPVLRLYRHGDGGLALFNGAGEEDGFRIDLVLQRADGRSRPRLSAPQSGFQRLQAGRTLLLVDAGAPPPPGYDGQAHAGCLSFEMSVGRERLIVNCGAPSHAGGQGAWRQAMRATAAHSTLTLAETNSSPLAHRPLMGAQGLLRRPETVACRREEAGGATLLEMAHDGYGPNFGVTHHRRLFLAADGDDLRGEDRLEPLSAMPRDGLDFAIRFHLHPKVQASMLGDGGALLRLRKGGGWRLRVAGAELAIEDSVYLGGETLRRGQQIVLRGRLGRHEARVKWALRRESAKRS